MHAHAHVVAGVLAVGDFILEVDGQAVPDLPSAARAFSSAGPAFQVLAVAPTALGAALAGTKERRSTSATGAAAAAGGEENEGAGQGAQQQQAEGEEEEEEDEDALPALSAVAAAAAAGYSMEACKRAACTGDLQFVQRCTSARPEYITAGHFGGSLGLLHASCLHGQHAVAEWLIARGADVNGHGDAGARPIHHAAMMGFAELVRLLVFSGADVAATNNAGQTAADCVCGSVGADPAAAAAVYMFIRAGMLGEPTIRAVCGGDGGGGGGGKGGRPADYRGWSAVDVLGWARDQKLGAPTAHKLFADNVTGASMRAVLHQLQAAGGGDGVGSGGGGGGGGDGGGGSGGGGADDTLEFGLIELGVRVALFGRR
jgi:hypothetical protein